MYPKKNNNSGKKESNNYPGDVSKEEIAAENDSISLFQSIGNEGMNRFLDSSFHDKKLRGEYEDNSIEMNDSEDDLMNSIEAAPELDQSMVVYAPKWKKINKSKKKGSKKNNDIEDGLIDFGNAARRSGANPPKQEQKKIKEAKKQEEEINKEKDPEKIIDKIPGDVADELIKAAPELDQSMIVHAPKWEKINKSKKKS